MLRKSCQIMQIMKKYQVIKKNKEVINYSATNRKLQLYVGYF